MICHYNNVVINATVNATRTANRTHCSKDTCTFVLLVVILVLALCLLSCLMFRVLQKVHRHFRNSRRQAGFLQCNGLMQLCAQHFYLTPTSNYVDVDETPMMMTGECNSDAEESI